MSQKRRLQHHLAGWADTTPCHNAQTQSLEIASDCFKKQPLKDLKAKLLLIQYGGHQAFAIQKCPSVFIFIIMLSVSDCSRHSYL